MFIFHVFHVRKDDRNVEGPGFGTGDILELKALFPKHLIWKCRTSQLGNQYYPTIGEAEAFYHSLVEYYANNNISDKPYSASGMHSEIMSNLASVFDELIDFFEKECGFKKSQDAEKIITEKQKLRREKLSERHAAERKSILEYFTSLPDLKRPDDLELIARLKAKRREYEKRLADCNMHPDLAKYIRPDYRANTYKFRVISSVLENSCIKPAELVTKAMKEYGDSFDPNQFLQACVIIAHYIGQPIPGIEVQKELPLLPEPVATA